MYHKLAACCKTKTLVCKWKVREAYCQCDNVQGSQKYQVATLAMLGEHTCSSYCLRIISSNWPIRSAARCSSPANVDSH
jgi:hypothetical protein